MKTVQDYLDAVAEDKKEAFFALRETICNNLPAGFEETLAYNMITYVVPISTYPKGYHCKSEQALPFISIAAQKNFIALYHMGIYAETELSKWFVQEYPKHAKTKLDMGKSCIRFKKMTDIPYTLIATLMTKISVQDWITLYETNLKNS